HWAPHFIGATPLQMRLTAVAAFADFARLLLFPLHLRVDYSPDERTLVPSALDARLALGLACFAVWAALITLAWRRGRRLEAYGLGWIGIALLPVANLVFPVGVLVAERTLYLPFDGPGRMVGIYLAQHDPEKALEAYRIATSRYDKLPWVHVAGADAALSLGRSALADSTLHRLEALCSRCDFYYWYEARMARARG